MTIPYLGPMGGIALPKWLVNPETDDELAQRYPGTFGDPIPGPLNPVWPQNALPSVPALSPGELGMLQSQTPSQETMTAPVTPGWAANLFGGADPLAQGMFRARDARALGRQALLNASLNILANSGPSPYRRGLGEILAGGIQAGQQSYQQGAQQALAQRGALQQQQILAQRQRLAQQYAGKSDIPSLTAYLHDLIGIGDYEGARSLSEYLKSQRENAVRGVQVETVDARGRPITQLVDPTNGQPIGTPFTSPPKPQTGTDLSERRFDYTMAKDWEGRFLNPQRKAIEAYNLFRSHLAEARAGNPRATKSLISAFAANADPFNQLRLGMLNYLSEIDPSAAGRVEIAFQKAKDGTLPPDQVAGLAAIVESNMREIEDRYRTNWQELVGRQPGTRQYLTSPDALFHRQGASSPTSGNRFMTRRP